MDGKPNRSKKKKRIRGDGTFVASIRELKASSTRTMFCLNSAPVLVLHSWPLTLQMTIAQVVETSITVNSNSPIH